jgi:hypothetical protein
MEPLKIVLVCLAILPLGLGSIHVAEKLRWYEQRRGLWKVATASGGAFACVCAFLLLYSGAAFTVGAYLKTLLQMLFATYFPVALAYLLHCVVWVVTRLGRRVFLDELFSRVLVFAIFGAVDLGAYLILSFFFGA